MRPTGRSSSARGRRRSPAPTATRHCSTRSPSDRRARRYIRLVAIRTDALLRRASEAQRASKRVALRQSFGGTEADWIELIKDVVALANSGGGVIVFEGSAPGVDRAFVREALARYARTDFDDYEDRKSTRLNSSHTVISYAVF